MNDPSNRHGAGKLALPTLFALLMAGIGQAADLIEIRAVEGMKFDPPRKQIERGQRVTILFQNADATDQPHNFVITRPGKLKAAIEAALALGTDGPAREFIPAGDFILAASALLHAGERQEVIFDVPSEAGIYPYVCTFPGHGFLMFGAFYAGVKMPPEANDPNIPKTAAAAVKITADPRPMVRRMFMPDAGPASIAVALRGRQNFCWDAGDCRLRYIWEGGFIDAERYFKSKGQSNATLPGTPWWTAAPGFPLRLDGRSPQRVEFKGYHLRDGIPQFEYIVDGVPVRERIAEIKDGSIAWQFETDSASPVTIVVGSSSSVAVTSADGAITNGHLEIPATRARKFQLLIRKVEP
jgi:azurin